MDASNALTVLGLVATVVFGALSIYLVVKRKYPGRLVFFNEQCIALFQDLVKNLPRMQVLYANEPVSENLVLLKGVIANTGSKDISKDMVSHPLRAVLPEGFKWLEAKIVSASPGVSGDIHIDKTNLEFDLGLFRCEESLRFEALAEVPQVDASNVAEKGPAQRLREALKFQHRIADTGKVETLAIPRPFTKRRKTYLITVSIYVLVVAGMASYFQFFRRPMLFHYMVAIPARGVVEVVATPHMDGMVELVAERGKYRSIVPLEKLHAMKAEPIIRPANPWPMYITLVGVAILASSVYFPVITEIRRSRKWRRMIPDEHTPQPPS